MEDGWFVAHTGLQATDGNQDAMASILGSFHVVHLNVKSIILKPKFHHFENSFFHFKPFSTNGYKDKETEGPMIFNGR